MDLDDLLSEPVTVHARAGVKFQPKARPKGKVKGTVFPAPSRFDSSKDKPVTAEVRHADISKSGAHLVPLAEIVSINLQVSSADAPDEMPCRSTLLDSSSPPVIQHPVNHNGALFQEVSVSGGDRIFAPVDVSPQFVTTGEDVASTDPSFAGVTNISDIHRYKQAGFARSGLEEVLNNGDAAADSHGVSWVDDVRLESEEETFGRFNSLDTATGNAFLIPSANESLEDDLTPTFPSDNCIDSSTMGFSDSVPKDAPLEQVTDEFESFAERSYPKVVTQEELVDSPSGHVISGEENERSVFAASSRNGTGKFSRLQRNELSPLVAADEMREETLEDQHLLSEPAHNPLVNADDNDEYFRGEEAPNLKRTRQNSKKPVSGSEKTGYRHKKTDVPDSSDKAPKKKFSHSTRRNRRKVDKILLETPDHEIDPRKLTLKDLILLAEAKERLVSKDPNAAKNSSPNQSNTQDTPFGEEDSFGLRDDSFGLRDDSFGYQDDEQAAPSVQPKLNYHTFMNRTSKVRWSQQDTELFYEGIRQFGTDFAMIQQLFPGRTRHQVKLKYKKEERQQPMRLSDALTNRSKNHSHFELVIGRLKKAAAEAEAEENYDRDDESIGVTGEEEEVTPDTNEEVTQNENQEKFEEEVGEGTMEGEEVATMNRQAYSPVKCHEESEEEDVYDIWSEYKSDI